MRIPILLILALFSSAVSAQQWFCLENRKEAFSPGEQSSDYSFNSSSGPVQPRDAKFALMPHSDPQNPDITHLLRVTGAEKPVAPCQFSKESGYMRCRNGQAYFDMNGRNGRYTLFDPSGYLEKSRDGAALISIGRCSPK